MPSRRAGLLWLWFASALLFVTAWTLVHRGPYHDSSIIDTPVYQGYGDRIVARTDPVRGLRPRVPAGRAAGVRAPVARPRRAAGGRRPRQLRRPASSWRCSSAGSSSSARRRSRCVPSAPGLLRSGARARRDRARAAPARADGALALRLLARRGHGGRRRARGVGTAALGRASCSASPSRSRSIPAALVPLLVVDAWRARGGGRREAAVCGGLVLGAALAPLRAVPLRLAVRGLGLGAQADGPAAAGRDARLRAAASRPPPVRAGRVGHEQLRLAEPLEPLLRDRGEADDARSSSASSSRSGSRSGARRRIAARRSCATGRRRSSPSSRSARCSRRSS